MAPSLPQSFAWPRHVMAALQSLAPSTHDFTSLTLSASLSFLPSHETFTLDVTPPPSPPASLDDELEQSDSTRSHAFSPSSEEHAGRKTNTAAASDARRRERPKTVESFIGVCSTSLSTPDSNGTIRGGR